MLDCAGDCGGSAVLSGCDNTCNSTLVDDECGVCDGDGSTCSSIELSFGTASDGSVDVLYTASGEVSGYQFDVSGMNITGATSDLDVSAAGSTVIGFKLFGDNLPAGSGTLVTLAYDATAESSSLSLGNFGDVTDGNGNPYATVSFGGDLTHGPADCAGAFGGDAVEDNCGTCDSDA